MSKFPLDIVNFNDEFAFELETAITICNAIQDDFLFTKANREFATKFKLIHFEENDGNDFIELAHDIKKELSGYYPFLLFISANPLEADDWRNLYSYTKSEMGISILTTNNVAELIIPKDKMTAFFVYYFARILMKFLLVGKYNHSNPSKNGCIFDFMQEKTDILKSMRANSICDDCKREIRKHEKQLSESQYHSLDKLLAKSGQLISETIKDDSKIRIFIGSSTEALPIARKIKSGLKYDAHVDTWADGVFDEPGKVYIEVLESILNDYEYGIFVFNPDDSVFSRGKNLQIPRDNVIFEYGMFLGKHTRKKAFFIIPRGVDIKIMTDVLGITCLDYDPTNPNLQSAVSDACDQIRDLIEKRRN